MFYLVKCVTNDFNVHLIQVLFRYAVLEERSWNLKRIHIKLGLLNVSLSFGAIFCSARDITMHFSLKLGGTHPGVYPRGWRCKALRGSGRCSLLPSARSCPVGDILAPVQRWRAGGACPWSAGWRYRSCSCTWNQKVDGEGLSWQSREATLMLAIWLQGDCEQLFSPLLLLLKTFKIGPTVSFNPE